jgi:hypothetical protein
MVAIYILRQKNNSVTLSSLDGVGMVLQKKKVLMHNAAILSVLLPAVIIPSLPTPHSKNQVPSILFTKTKCHSPLFPSLLLHKRAYVILSCYQPPAQP